MTTLKKTIDYSFTPGEPLKPAVYETTCTNVPDVPPPVPPGPNPGGALGKADGSSGNFPTTKIAQRTIYVSDSGQSLPPGSPGGRYVIISVRTYYCASGVMINGRCR